MVIEVGRYWENGYDAKRHWVWPGASTHLLSTPEEGDDEEYNYENISAMQHDRL